MLTGDIVCDRGLFKVVFKTDEACETQLTHWNVGIREENWYILVLSGDLGTSG